jgi:hypothetical protein
VGRSEAQAIEQWNEQIAQQCAEVMNAAHLKECVSHMAYLQDSRVKRLSDAIREAMDAKDLAAMRQALECADAEIRELAHTISRHLLDLSE